MKNEKTRRESVLSLLPRLPGWLAGDDLDSAIVLTTRLRFARDLQGEHFPHQQNRGERLRVLKKVSEALEAFFDRANFIELNKVSPLEAGLLVERRLISPQMAQDTLPRGVFLWKKEDISLMVCEEDHLRLAAILPGLQPRKAYHLLEPIAEDIRQRLPIAYDSERGYLTSCPTNLGEAIRFSFFCHLPGQALTGEMDSFVKSVADAGITVRGFWGQGSEILGNIFQFTDGPSLSLSPEESLSRMETLGRQIIEREAMARINLQGKSITVLQDKIARGLGILQSCRMLESAESLSLFSAARLGVDLGWIKGVNVRTISQLTLEIGPAFLTLSMGRKGRFRDRQVLRAEKVRKTFAKASFSL